MASPSEAVDPGGTLHLRPHGATVLSLVVVAMAVALSLEAVLRAGWDGVLVLPVPLLVIGVVWALLWAPRVVLHDETVEVRNVLTTELLPFGAIREVRLGAMLRFDVEDAVGGVSTVTAWNAPALGRDAPWRREVMLHEQQLRGRRLTPQERLVHDQRRSRSAVVKQRWERWSDRQEEAHGSSGAASGAAPDAVATSRVNILPITVVGGLALLVLARVLL